MLRFILGVASSGKTYNVISKIKETLQSSESEVFLLVPEQYSFECEKILLKELGTALANKVQVVSFTNLCRRILSDLGGLNQKVADEQTRFIMMSEALKQVGDELEVYSKYSRDTSFAQKLIKDIQELKQAAVTLEQIDSCRQALDKELFKKLSDVSTVLQAYDGLLKSRFIDPDDISAICAQKAAVNGWFKGKTIFADGFTGFTGVQYVLLEQAIRQADSCVFSFTSDGFKAGDETDIFKNIKKEIAVIRAIASKYGVKEEPPIILGQSRSVSGISAVEAFLRTKQKPQNNLANEVTVCKCARPVDEVEYAASVITKLVREQNRRYKDFIIITGSDAGYEKTVESVFGRAKIPCFISKNHLLCETLLARFICSAFECITEGFQTEDILRFAKSDLSGVDKQLVDELEEYVYIWDINGKKWLQEWDMSPYGLEKSFETEEERQQRLLSLNQTRRQIVAPLESFRSKLSEKVNGNIKSLFYFLEEFKVSKKLGEYAEWLNGQSDFEGARLQSASWDAVITVLDRLSNCLGDREISVDEFYEIIKKSFELQTVGEIPSRTDEVIFGTADRIRPMRPKVVIVLGANSGVFPAGISNCGLFTLSERNQLLNAGIPLPDRYLAAAREQNYLFYNAVCSASDLVYITFCDQKGEATLKESVLVKQILETFEVNNEKYCFLSARAKDIEYPAAAFRYLASSFNKKSADSLTVEAALKENPEYKEKLKALGKGRSEFTKKISNQAAEGLYGKEIYISPSKIENYYSCPLSYFLKNGLGARVVRKAGVNSMTRGTLAHYILETVIKDYQGRYHQLDKAAALSGAKAATEEYFRSIKVDITTIDAASRMVIEGVCEQVSAVIAHIANDFVDNGFAPKNFELSIKGGGEIPALKIRGESCNINIIGQVDRVDTFTQGDETYVRIVDYKTGHKEFRLSDILGGRNLQMLVYLCAIVKNGDALFGNPKPAGILYIPALPSINDESGLKVKPSVFLTDDTEILSEMDSELSGKYIPIKQTAKGFGDKTPVASEEEFEIIFSFLCKKASDMANELKGGNITPDPIDVENEDACKYCDYRAVCGRERQEPNKKSEFNGMSTRETIEKLKEIIEWEDGGKNESDR